MIGALLADGFRRVAHHPARAFHCAFTVGAGNAIAITVDARGLHRTALAIAGATFLVGGLRIMDRLILAVCERRRELALRMVLGAQPWQVAAGFLVEATLLAFLGGAAGALLGEAGARLFAARVERPDRVLSAALLSALVLPALSGIFFGAAPARRAARIDPARALRRE